MAQVFLSYSREDLDRVKPLVAALEAEGLSVWWDRELIPGQRFEETIDREIQSAQCVVVVWSEHSVASHWVKNEALEGLDRSILVPIVLDDVRIPVAFKQVQSADLRGWPDEVDPDEYSKLVAVVDSKLGRGPRGMALQGLHNIAVRRRKRRTRRRLLAPAAFAALAVALVLALTERAPNRAAVRPTLAVVPFAHEEGEDAAFYADSLTHEIPRTLADFQELDLVQVGSLWDLSITNLPSGAPYEEADYVLAGRVSTDPEAIRVSIQLREQASQQIVLQTRFKEARDEFFELQRKLALSVVSQLSLAGTTGLTGPELKPASSDSVAYREYLRGLDLMRRGEEQHLRQAISHLQQALQRDPNFASAHAATCRAYLAIYRLGRSQPDYNQGRQSCEQALELNPNEPAVQLAMAELYQARGDLESAKYHYSRALEIDSRDADATMGLARIFDQEADYRAAEQLYIQATRLKPTYWKAHNMLGSFYFTQGLYFQAMESYLRVTQLTTANATAYNNLGAARFYAGDFNGANEAWQQAADLSTDPAAYSNIGTALFLARRFEEALRYFQIAVEMAPGDHRLWGNIADNLRHIEGGSPRAQGAYAKAQELVEQILEVNEDAARDLSRLSVYQAALGQAEEARRNIEIAGDLGGDDYSILYDLAVAEMLLGDRDAAFKYMTNALEAGYPEVLLRSDPEFDALRSYD